MATYNVLADGLARKDDGGFGFNYADETSLDFNYRGPKVIAEIKR